MFYSKTYSPYFVVIKKCSKQPEDMFIIILIQLTFSFNKAIYAYIPMREIQFVRITYYKLMYQLFNSFTII